MTTDPGLRASRWWDDPPDGSPIVLEADGYLLGTPANLQRHIRVVLSSMPSMSAITPCLDTTREFKTKRVHSRQRGHRGGQRPSTPSNRPGLGAGRETVMVMGKGRKADIKACTGTNRLLRS